MSDGSKEVARRAWATHATHPAHSVSEARAIESRISAFGLELSQEGKERARRALRLVSLTIIPGAAREEGDTRRGARTR